MRPSVSAIGLILLGSLGACGDDGDGASATTGAGAGGAGGAAAGGGGGAPACGDAAGTIPSDAVVLAWDDGATETNLRDQTFEITVSGQTFVLNEEPLHEAVRFDLEHPATVYGFAIAWAGLPDGADPKTLLEAGLYRDFGHNGFDFWAPDPLFTGTRCAGDIGTDGFVTYVLPEPIVLDQPSLLYVAHLAEPGSAVFGFDGSTTQADGSCVLWDDCHSAMNLPEALLSQFYDGLSFPFQYDYRVKLFVRYDEELAPEDRIFQPIDLGTTSGHASFGDYDADGFDDLITEGPTLWHNDGTGGFELAPAGALPTGLAATGGVFGDYDNDGCLDIFLFAESYAAPDTLLHAHCDGTFDDVTLASGIVDTQTYEDCNDAVNDVRSPTAAAAWVDLDADGFLDLYEANFICWEKETYYVDSVWHAVGDGTFEDWSGTRGFTTLRRASRGVAPADFDDDGDVDLFVNNYRLQANMLFENLGDGTFTESAVVHGVAGEKDGVYYGHTIGAAWGDIDGDGRLDLVAANLAHPRFFDFSDRTQILVQDALGGFADVAATDGLDSPAGLRYEETYSVPVLADFDADGALDLALTAVYDGRPTDFYWGNGDGTFRFDGYHAGITTENGWGIVASDFDNDGDPDLFAHQPFVNTLPASGHYLEVRVVGDVASNRAALGASVFVDTAAGTQVRSVQGGTGKGGQDSLYLHFGLGAETTVDAIRVHFPGGASVQYDGPFAADQRVWVYESGSALTGWVHPT